MTSSEDVPEPTQKPLWWWALWLLAGLLIGAQALRMRAAESAVESRNGLRAVALRPQNGWGHALVAQQALEARNARLAIAESRRALQLTPLSVAAVRTLARALAGQGANAGASEAAWQIASSMGWRDRPTQLWALLRALSNGEAEVLVMRADALMRTRPDDAEISAVIRQALTAPQIRATFVKRLAIEPKWRSQLFSSGRPLTPPELGGAVPTLLALAATDRPPDRAELRDSILGLIAVGRYRDALALDRRFISRKPDAGSLLDDGGFELAGADYRTDTTPFDWMISGTSATLDRSGGRASMVINTSGSSAKNAVERYARLSPGTYRLQYAMSGEPHAPASIGVRVYCAGSTASLGNSTTGPLSSSGWSEREFAFTVPAGCELAHIVIGSLPRAEAAEALIDDVRISTASARNAVSSSTRN